MKCKHITTDRVRECNVDCRNVGRESELLKLISASSNAKHHHNECNSIGHSRARAIALREKHNAKKELKRALEKVTRLRGRESTLNDVLTLMAQNDMGIAYKVLHRYGSNPDKLISMTKKILEHEYHPHLGTKDSALIKKYMMIAIMAGSQVLQVLSYFDFQSSNFPKTIREKVLSNIRIKIPLSNLIPTESSVNLVLQLIREDLHFKKNRTFNYHNR